MNPCLNPFALVTLRMPSMEIAEDIPPEQFVPLVPYRQPSFRFSIRPIRLRRTSSRNSRSNPYRRNQDIPCSLSDQPSRICPHTVSH